MPPQQDSICAYLRLSGVNLRNYKTRAPKDCAKRGRAPKPHGKFTTRKAGIFVNLYLHPPHVLQLPLHRFACVPVAENIVPL